MRRQIKQKHFLLFLLISFFLGFLLWKTKEYFPFNVATRNTRGMSYDLRCTPKIFKRDFQWNYGTMDPNHYGKCLEVKSCGASASME